MARMATLPKSGLKGQKIVARGKASGVLSLALPRENDRQAESPPLGGVPLLFLEEGCQKIVCKTQLVRAGKHPGALERRGPAKKFPCPSRWKQLRLSPSNLILWLCARKGNTVRMFSPGE